MSRSADIVWAALFVVALVMAFRSFLKIEVGDPNRRKDDIDWD